MKSVFVCRYHQSF
jgi:hypothetical protein